MTKRSLGALGVIASVIAVVSVAAIPGASQAQSPEPSSWSPPLLPDGQPDMQGLYVPNWGSASPERWAQEEREEYAALLLERYDVSDAGTRGGGDSPEFGEGGLQGDLPPGTVMVVDPPDGKIPYLPWAAAKRQYMQEHLYDREEFISTRTRCFPAGLPRDMSMGSGYNGWQVVQAPGLSSSSPSGTTRIGSFGWMGGRMWARTSSCGWATHVGAGRGIRWSSMRRTSPTRPGWSATELATARRITPSTAQPCICRNDSRLWMPTTSTTKSRSKTRTCFRDRGRFARSSGNGRRRTISSSSMRATKATSGGRTSRTV